MHICDKSRILWIMVWIFWSKRYNMITFLRQNSLVYKFLVVQIFWRKDNDTSRFSCARMFWCKKCSTIKINFGDQIFWCINIQAAMSPCWLHGIAHIRSTATKSVFPKVSHFEAGLVNIWKNIWNSKWTQNISGHCDQKIAKKAPVTQNAEVFESGDNSHLLPAAI